MTPKAPSPYAVWLAPALPERALLGELIRDLAEQRDGPAFEPHVTLCSGRWDADLEDLTGRVRAFAAAHAPFGADVRGLDGTAEYFKALFARLALPEGLQGEALAAFPGSHAQEVGPHLALLYGEPAKRVERTALAAAIAAHLPTTIRFDALHLVLPTGGDWRDLTRWRTLAREPLGRRAVR